MSTTHHYDAVIVGSGPNGLAAAVRLALEGLSVKVLEASDTIGGGTRTLELSEPGFRHDICSSIHPMAASSPFLKKLPLEQYGLEWIQPDFPLAHPLDGGISVIQHRDIRLMADELGTDIDSYLKLIRPLVDQWDNMTPDLLAPLQIPDHPFRMARFGMKALLPAKRLIQKHFKSTRGRALFAGLAAHSILDLNEPATSAIGLVLGAAAHSVGWPLPRGGSQSITDALAGYLKHLGGEIETGVKVTDMKMLPDHTTVLFDLTPQQVNDIVGDSFPDSYKKKLRSYRYGAGVFKIDYILREPVPWQDSRCQRAGTVHVGGTFEDILASEKKVAKGVHPDQPFVLVTQQSMFDETRTPDNRHTLWAYCHVPHGSDRDMTNEIETQIERFAPGFRDVIDFRRTLNTHQMEAYNANYIGGDIIGGTQDIWQLFNRPVSFFSPYSTPLQGIYFCSSSTPPGGGVHGMCGYHAAETVLKKEFRISRSDQKFRL